MRICSDVKMALVAFVMTLAAGVVFGDSEVSGTTYTASEQYVRNMVASESNRTDIAIQRLRTEVETAGYLTASSLEEFAGDVSIIGNFEVSPTNGLKGITFSGQDLESLLEAKQEGLTPGTGIGITNEIIYAKYAESGMPGIVQPSMDGTNNISGLTFSDNGAISIKVSSESGLIVSEEGEVVISSATKEDVDAQANEYKPIVPSILPYILDPKADSVKIVVITNNVEYFVTNDYWTCSQDDSIRIPIVSTTDEETVWSNTVAGTLHKIVFSITSQEWMFSPGDAFEDASTLDSYNYGIHFYSRHIEISSAERLSMETNFYDVIYNDALNDALGNNITNILDYVSTNYLALTGGNVSGQIVIAEAETSPLDRQGLLVKTGSDNTVYGGGYIYNNGLLELPSLGENSTNKVAVIKDIPTKWNWADITNTPTNLVGYGISEEYIEKVAYATNGHFAVFNENGGIKDIGITEDDFVPSSRTINGHSLSTNITLNASEIGAADRYYYSEPSITTNDVWVCGWDGTSLFFDNSDALDNFVWENESLFLRNDGTTWHTKIDGENKMQPGNADMTVVDFGPFGTTNLVFYRYSSQKNAPALYGNASLLSNNIAFSNAVNQVAVETDPAFTNFLAHGGTIKQGRIEFELDNPVSILRSGTTYQRGKIYNQGGHLTLPTKDGTFALTDDLSVTNDYLRLSGGTLTGELTATNHIIFGANYGLADNIGGSFIRRDPQTGLWSTSVSILEIEGYSTLIYNKLDKTALSGNTFDFSTNAGLYLAISNLIYACGGSVTNFPAIPTNN